MSQFIFNRSSFQHLSSGNMAAKFIVLVCALAVAVAIPAIRQKRQFGGGFNGFDNGQDIEEPLGLSSGAFDVLGNIQSTFTCEGQIYGFYADMSTDCRVFHVCFPVTYPDGNAETLQWSFFCGNQTVFDQSVLACVHVQDAIPCNTTPDFFFRNQEFGIIPERTSF